MGRPALSSDVDQLERIMRRRNAICSKRLLMALQLNHGEMIPERKPESASIIAIAPEPAPDLIPINKIDQIKRIVCKRYGISRADIESYSRSKNLVLPRQIGMYLAHEYNSFPEIGRRYGGRDHATVLHAFRKIERLAQIDANLAKQLAQIRAELSA